MHPPLSMGVMYVCCVYMYMCLNVVCVATVQAVKTNTLDNKDCIYLSTLFT